MGDEAVCLYDCDPRAQSAPQVVESRVPVIGVPMTINLFVVFNNLNQMIDN